MAHVVQPLPLVLGAVRPLQRAVPTPRFARPAQCEDEAGYPNAAKRSSKTITVPVLGYCRYYVQKNIAAGRSWQPQGRYPLSCVESGASGSRYWAPDSTRGRTCFAFQYPLNHDRTDRTEGVVGAVRAAVGTVNFGDSAARSLRDHCPQYTESSGSLRGAKKMQNSQALPVGLDSA